MSDDYNLNSIVKCKVSNDHGVYRITALDGIHLKAMLDGARRDKWYSFDKIKPVPLTHNLITSLGFAYCGSWDITGMIYLKSYTRQYDNEEIKIRIGKLKEDPKKMYYFSIGLQAINNIYFVHQVQNVFLSVTREQLDTSNFPTVI